VWPKRARGTAPKNPSHPPGIRRVFDNCKSENSMGRHALWTAMLAAGLLAGCGGGGGGDADAPAAANVTLSGTAAKGLMANATVTAHAVKADGTVDDAALGTATTDGHGAYQLVFDATKDQPYVIRVVATADTTHVDELTGTAKPLPAGFTMRSL